MNLGCNSRGLNNDKQARARISRASRCSFARMSQTLIVALPKHCQSHAGVRLERMNESGTP